MIKEKSEETKKDWERYVLISNFINLLWAISTPL